MRFQRHYNAKERRSNAIRRGPSGQSRPVQESKNRVEHGKDNRGFLNDVF